MTTGIAPELNAPPDPAGAGTPGQRSRRTSRRRFVIAAGVLAVVGAVVLVRAGKRDRPPAPVRDVPTLEGDRIRYSAAFAKRAAISIAPVELREVAPVVLAPGIVELDPRRSAAVGTRIPGRVRNILKFEGDEVRAGDVLAEIESPELGRAQSELLKARAREEATEADRIREERLAEARITSLRDAQAARAAALSARAERIAAEQAVRTLGGSVDGRGEIGVLQLRAPIAGRVISSKLNRGKSLETAETPFLIADVSHVWLRMDVFERDLGSVRAGDAVEVARQADLTRIGQGKVARSGDVINPQTHSAEVWVEVENHEQWLKPGESVGARIRGRGDGRKWPAVPPDAIVTVDGKPTIFVGAGENTVHIRQVKLGTVGDKYTAVLSGLQEGEQVVVQGAFALKSELFR